MKHKLLNKLWLRSGMLVAILCTLFAGQALADTTATIKFGSASGSTKVDSKSTTGDDSQGNTWTITTEGTTSFTQNSSYSQIGSSSKPATSITFTTTLAEDVNVKSFSAKFGGFNGTAGTVTLKVGDTSVGSGSLNATDDVTVSSSSAEVGRVLTVTVTGISKGVKAYQISYTYAPASIPITSIAFNQNEAEVQVGGTVTITPTILPAGYTETPVWESDDEDVATVDDGIVTGVAEGTAFITLTSPTDGSIYDICEVTVSAATPVTGVTLDQTSKALYVGDEFDLTATVAPIDATNKNVTWTSSDDTKATVVNGHVTALAAGTPTITVTTEDGSYTATCNLTITNVAVTGVTLDKSSATIYVGSFGNTVQLTPTIAPANATNKAVTWTSSDETKATVSSTGLVTAVAVGSTTITVTTTDGSYTATCAITVEDAPGSAEKPYTVAQAKAAIDAGTGVTGVYVKGIVSQVDSYDGTKYITYWISDDGTTTNQFEVYKGLGIGGASFSAITDVKVGDKVVVKGNITLYSSSIYEFSKDNQLVSIATLNFVFGAASYEVERGEDLTITASSSNSSGAITYSSNATEIAEINATTGAVTAKKEGEATITATIAPADGFPGKSIDVTLTVTDSREVVSISFANAEVFALDENGEYTQAATVAQGDYTGTISYAIESSTSDGALIDDATGELAFDKKGVIVVKATAPETEKYKSNTATYTLKVRTTPTILVENQSIAYEGTYTYDAASNVEGGAVTLTSGTPAVASVAELVLTGDAVGTSTIMVSTAANDEYIAGSETFVLTVTAPAGSTTAPSSENVVFNEGFSRTTYVGGRDGKYSGNVSSTSLVSSTHTDESWTYTYFVYANNSCTKVGKTSSSGTLTSASISMGDATTGTLSFSAAGWEKDNTTFSGTVTITNAKFTGNSSSYDFTPTQGSFDDFEIGIINITGDITLSFSGYCYFLDDVKVTTEGPAPTATVTLNKYGYATYCSVNPIDFSSTTGYTAWRVSSIAADGTITFAKITEKIKGGQGVLLYNKDADGVNTSEATITFADGSRVFTPAENKLVGTTAPYYISEVAQVYGLSGDKFVKNNAPGNIPTGKAFILASSLPSGVKAFNFVFDDDDDDATNINSLTPALSEGEEAIYNLAGQRMNKMQKGINIVNGKKILK